MKQVSRVGVGVAPEEYHVHPALSASLLPPPLLASPTSPTQETISSSLKPAPPLEEPINFSLILPLIFPALLHQDREGRMSCIPARYLLVVSPLILIKVSPVVYHIISNWYLPLGEVFMYAHGCCITQMRLKNILFGLAL